MAMSHPPFRVGGRLWPPNVGGHSRPSAAEPAPPLRVDGLRGVGALRASDQPAVDRTRGSVPSAGTARRVGGSRRMILRTSVVLKLAIRSDQESMAARLRPE